MAKQVTSSRQRFTAVKQLSDAGRTTTGRPGARSRSSRRLVLEFWRLLQGQVAPIVVALSSLTVATLLALLPPAGTNFLIDYVLIDAPLPQTAPDWIPRNRYWLLLAITGGVALISLVKLAIHF